MDWQESDSNPGSKRSGVQARMSRGLEKVMPVIAALESPLTDTPLQGVAAWGGLGFEAMQQLGFCINPRFGFTMTVCKELSFLLFTTHLPLWDSSYVELSYKAFAVCYWVAVVPIVVVMLYFFGSGFEYFEPSRHPYVMCAVVPCVHLIATIFSIPVLHTLSANMFCYQGALWAFPDKDCWEIESTLYFCFSILIMFFTSLTMGVGAIALFTDNTASKSILARAHGRMDVLVTFQKIALVLLFHLLLGPGWRGTYCVFLVLLNLICFTGYTYQLPYYHLKTNQIKCAIHFAAAAAGTVSFFSTVEQDSFTRHNGNALAVFAFLPLAGVMGYHIGGMRPMPECLERMEHLEKFGEVFQHRCYFPTGLVDHDQYFSRMNSLETDILEAQRDLETQTTTEVLVPYIETVLLTTDVELSTRFLLLYADATSCPVGADMGSSAHMVAFASRIFIKGIVKYKTKTIIHFHFANFVKTFCPPSKLVFSLEQCDAVLKEDLDISTRFQAYRMLMFLRQHLGIHDRSHMFSLNKAKRYHKDALNDMSTFWLKLMDSKYDLLSLAYLTNQITEKRDKGLAEYYRALQEGSSNREVLTSYASFLDSVMLDKKLADVIQTHISELGEELVKSMMSSKATGPKKAKVDVRTLTVEPNEGDFTSNKVSNNSAVFMSKASTATLVLGVVVILTMLALGTVSAFVQRDMFDRVVVCGMARTTVQIAAREVMLISMQDPQMSHVRLKTELDLFLMNHNKLTFGDKTLEYNPLRDVLCDKRYLMEDCDQSCYIPTGLWGLGLEVASAMTTIARSSSNDSTATAVEADARDVTFILSNAPESVTWSFDDAYSGLKDEANRNERWFIAGMSLVLCLTAYIMISINTIFTLNFQKIGANKMVAIHLFSLIPYSTQKQLHHASREKIKEFDRQAREADKGTEALDTDALGPEEEVEEDSTALPRQSSKRLSQSRSKSVFTDKDDPLHGQSLRLTSILVRHRKGKTLKKKKRKAVTFNLNLPGESDAKPKPKLVEMEPVIPDIEQVGLSVEERMELLTEDGGVDGEGGPNETHVANIEEDRPTHAWLIIVAMVLFFVNIGLVYTVQQRSSSFVDDGEQLEETVKLITQLWDAREVLSQSAISIAATGAPDIWLQYWSTLNSNTPRRLKKKLMHTLREDELSAYGEVEHVVRRVEHTEKIVLYLSGVSWGLSPGLLQHLGTFDWDADPQYGHNQKEVDLAKSPYEQRLIAKKVLVSEQHRGEAIEVNTRLLSLVSAVTKRLLSDKDDARTSLTILSVCSSISCAVIILIILFLGKVTPSLRYAVLILIMLLIIPHVIVLMVNQRIRDMGYDDIAETYQTRMLLQQKIWELHEQVGALVGFENKLSYEEYWVLYDKDEIETHLDWALDASVDVTAAYNKAKANVGALSNLHFILFELMQPDDHSERYAYRGDHAGYQWDIYTEGRNSIPSGIYTNRTADMAKTKAERDVIVRNSLFIDGYRLLNEAMESTTELFQIIVEDELSDTDELASAVDTEMLVVLIFMCVCLVLLCVVSVMLGLIVTEMGTNSVSQVVQKINSTLFQGIMLRCRVAFMLVLGGVALQFAIAFQLTQTLGDVIDDIDLAASREWAVARSAIAALGLYVEYKAGSVASNEVPDMHRLRVMELIEELSDIKNKLYLGTTSVDRMYGTWLTNMQEISTLGADDVTSATRTPEAIHNELITSMRPLIEELWTSGEEMVKSGKEDADQAWVLLTLVSCVLLVATVLLVKLLLGPVVTQLVNEEHGTKVLLKMIPSKVRGIVPKIATYLDTGVIVDEEEDKKLHPECATAVKLKEEFGKATVERQDKMLERIEKSQSGLVVSDAEGIIVACNENFLRMTGYSRMEALGKNVTIVVPSALVPIHQSFIENYLATGIARVVGKSRDVLMQDKYANLVHCYAHISELRRGANLFFIAQLDPYITPSAGR